MIIQKRRRIANSQLLCKICKKEKRVTKTRCQSCRKKHNKITRDYKRYLKSKGLCVMCKIPSTTRLCTTCRQKTIDYYKNSFHVKSRLAKESKYGDLNDLLKFL